MSNGQLMIRAAFHNSPHPIKYKSTGYSVPPNKIKGEYKYWDVKKNYAKGVENADIINAKIDRWKALFKEYIRHCKTYTKDVNIEYFRSLLDSDNPTIPTKTYDKNTLLHLGQMYLKSIQGTVKSTTIEQYEVVLTNLEEYQKELGYDITPEHINTEFYKNFGMYLIRAENNYNNTINRKLGRIVTIMEYAVNNNFTGSIAYKNRYKFKPSTAARFAVWPTEYEIIKKITAPKEEHQQLLDAFCFGCETTLRHSDIAQLYPGHLLLLPDGDDVLPVLDLTQIKTVNSNTIALTDHALQLWNKNVRDNRTKVFRIGSSKSASELLKKYFKKAKLNRKCEIVRTQGNKVERKIVPLYDAITFHMSRNTAITTQLSVMPHAYVMENAGIKKVDTLLGYYRDPAVTRHKTTRTLLNKKTTG